MQVLVGLVRPCGLFVYARWMRVLLGCSGFPKPLNKVSISLFHVEYFVFVHVIERDAGSG